MSQIQVNDKITIKDLPIYITNEAIKAELEEKGVKFVSAVKDSFERDHDGHLTSYRNGDKFAYIQKMDEPVPRNMTIANNSCTIIHHQVRDISVQSWLMYLLKQQS